MAKCCGTAAEDGGAATGRYYAVRAGYASSVTIRSAIFLHREHAHQFIADDRHNRHNITPSAKVEYAVFNSLEEAEAYLVEGEKINNSLKTANVGISSDNGEMKHILLLAPPGMLGIALQFLHQGAGEEKHPIIADIDPKCSFKAKVKRGDRLLSIAGMSITKPEQLSFQQKSEREVVFERVAPRSSPKTKKKRAADKAKSESKEAKWNSMLEELKSYKEQNNGSMVFPHKTNSQQIRSVKYWVSEQRREFKKLQKGQPSSLTAMRLQRLTEIGFDFQPIKDQVSWEERIQSLKSFVEEHGHCRPSPKHPELGIFVGKVRQQYRERGEGKSNTLTDERVSQLTELGFVFQAGKTPKLTPRKSWEDRFQELLEYKTEHGDTVVPQNSGPLGNWVRMQRVAYKKFKAGEKSTLTAEKALKLAEVGFCFEASDRFKCSKP